MDKNKNQEVQVYEASGREIIADPGQAPVVLGDVLKQMGMRGIPISAKELVDQTFVILRAKQFESSFATQDHAWFCLVKLEGSDDLYQTVIGGGAGVEILDAYAQSENSAPLQITLRWNEGGRFGGYYSFE